MTHELTLLSAPMLRELIDGGVDTVVVPFGSIEHQDGHLPLGADSLLADAVGREVADRLGAVLAPTLCIGCAEQHERLSGTLTLRCETVRTVAAEQATSLARQGFAVVVLVSTHGGNRPALDAVVVELNDLLPGVVVCAPRGDVGPDPGRHSGVWLTSVMMALRPDLVHVAGAGSELSQELQRANPHHGRAAFERFVASIVEGVQIANASD
jgi:creatinine amidohydrolase/Fe(II)-dependent formamide hydrolase-like protein